MAVENKIERVFTIRNYETDFKRRLKPSAILGYFQETASEHSSQMGLGFESLMENGYCWVLSKIYLEIERLPRVGETVKVGSWPHSPNKAIYERSFVVQGEGDVCVRAYSRWCILRADNGRIVPCSLFKQPQIDYIEDKSVCFDEWSIPELQNNLPPAFSLRVANSEYDLNYHVNNIKYADYIFNCFSVQELEQNILKCFQLHYIKQAHEGDVLDFYRSELTNGEYVVCGYKNGEELIVAAKVRFGKI